MTRVIGVDPGNTGALAVYDTDTNKITSVIDMPVFHTIINKKKRARIDAVALYDWLDFEKMQGCALVLIEAIGGRPSQSASGAFTLGYGVGMLYMACVSLRLPIETSPPTVWKKIMRVPGKKDKAGKQDKEFNGMIVSRACELIPDARDYFYGPQQGLKVDRAEACMLAKFAGDHALNINVRTSLAVETTLAYQNAETGA